jgi:hypothetical protein
MAFRVLDKKVKISKIPIWVKNTLLGLLRTFTSVKIYGGIEFFMTVLTEDLIAPSYGKQHLEEFFQKHKNE